MIRRAVSTSYSSTTSGGASRSELLPQPSSSSPFLNALPTSSCGISRAGSRDSARARRKCVQEGAAAARLWQELAAARAATRRGRVRRGHRPPDHRRVPARDVGLASKAMSMQDAVARFVRDGDVVVIEGFTHLISFAAGHEIIRQRRRDLTLCRLTPDLIYDQMIAAGCASKLVFSWAGNPGVGSLHAFRRAVEGQTLEIEEYSHFGMVARFSA